ncbi:pre-rRNA 2'-O-ribose RNA methyltransferase FTSJ3-like isoform X2 [Corticium candelabrum]|nr:pre-rRNA 2'-O-ribose RNA methyltransferase FTSJ3-like isoform X2 [Corticium candelabrum]
MKADCVLHDGAPNVGTAWIQDAFSQAMLCLKALKLACEFLTSNGFFITKVFRSRDYQPLMWVLQQLFRRVHATKPQASRSESAEIFVVCQGYLAPDKIDPLLLDPKMVFKEVDVAKKPQLFQQENKKPKAEGYDDKADSQFKSFKMSEFVTTDSFLEILSTASELVFDVDVLSKHPYTTDELRECCKDIKVLGKKEIKKILTWRVKMRHFLECEQQDNEKAECEKPAETDKHNENSVEETASLLQSDVLAELKRKQRRIQRRQQKVQERMRLKMSLPKGDPGVNNEEKLFSLSAITSKKALTDIDHSDMPQDINMSKDDDSTDEDLADNDVSSSNMSEDENFIDSVNQCTPGHSEEDSNPLLVQFSDANKAVVVTNWFNKDVFRELEDDEDEDAELSAMTGTHTGSEEVKRQSETATIRSEESTIHNEVEEPMAKKKKTTDSSNDHEESTGRKFEPLDPIGLAIGTRIATSKKAKQELEDGSYHRWAFNDTNLPAWFAEDERKYYLRQVPVTKEMVEEYKSRQREVNARPIKKVAEAKARKTKLRLRRLKKLNRKVESLEANLDVSEKDKVQQIQKLYKKLKKEPKKEVTYVVAKKGLVGRKAKRPGGVKGRYKMVDPRMKKDNRGQRQKDTGKPKFKKRKSAFR